jgi:TPR repeat protein
MVRREIEADPAPYARGCVAQAARRWADAVQWFNRGVTEGNCVLCLVQLALMLADGGRREDGLRLLRMAAAREDVRAMFSLGLLAEGAEKMRYLNRAADLGHKGAEALLKGIEAAGG